jgi:hypothetical protein
MFNHSIMTPATPNQLRTLQELGIDTNRTLSSLEAHRLIKKNREAWRKLPVTGAQQACLQRYVKWRPGMNRGEASDQIAKLLGLPGLG